jgi:hypothetical protein
MVTIYKRIKLFSYKYETRDENVFPGVNIDGLDLLSTTC